MGTDPSSNVLPDKAPSPADNVCPKSRNAWTRISIGTSLAATACIAILLAAFLRFAPGVEVCIHNALDATMFDVELQVTGKSYAVGDIASGATNRLKVRPDSESHIEISYRLAGGATKRHVIDCYIEASDRATVEATIRNEELTCKLRRSVQ